MSPEYKVHIVIPYTFVVEADSVIEAEEKAWQLYDPREYDVPKPIITAIELIDSETTQESKQRPLPLWGRERDGMNGGEPSG